MLKQSTFLRRVLKSLAAAGWTIGEVDDGYGRYRYRTPETIVKACKAVDVATVYVRKVESEGSVEVSREGWLFVVWQGPDESTDDGWEIVSDYSTNLSDVIEPLFDAADR